MINIDYGIDYIDVKYEEPITDYNIDEILESFGNLIIMRFSNKHENISLKKFINTKLSPRQKQVVNNYIREEIENLIDTYTINENTKSARKL
jgi:uncharacterized membrane protein YukC